MWELSEGLFGGILGGGVCVGKICLCKLFRKSEVVFGGGISEIRNGVGFGFWFGDLDFGCGELLWISGKGLGFCCGVGLWKSAANVFARYLDTERLFWWVDGGQIIDFFRCTFGSFFGVNFTVSI
jgi:hypothetical protein